MKILALTRSKTIGKDVHYYFLSGNIKKMSYRRNGRPLTRFQTRGRVVEHVQLTFPVKLRLTIPKKEPTPIQLEIMGDKVPKRRRSRRVYRRKKLSNETLSLPKSKLLFFEDPCCSNILCKMNIDSENLACCDCEEEDDGSSQECKCPERSVTNITDDMTYIQVKSYFSRLMSFFKGWRNTPRRLQNHSWMTGGKSPERLTSNDNDKCFD